MRGRLTAGWLLFVVLCLAAGLSVGNRKAATEDYRVGEAGRAEAMAAEGGLERRPQEQVLISGPDQAKATAEIIARMSRLAEVEAVDLPVRSTDGHTLVVVTLRGPELEARDHVAALRTRTAEVQARYPSSRVEQTGRASIGSGMDQRRGADLARSEMIALPVTLIVLWLVFGSVVAATVPLLLALTSIAAATGLAMLASHVFPDAGVGTNVIILIGMAVGVDYALFHLKTDNARPVIVSSGLAVALSAATLYLAGDVIYASLATATILVTLVAVAGAVTVLPATGGRRITGRPGRTWAWPARRPVTALVLAVTALLALATPLAGLEVTEISVESYSRKVPAVQTRDRLIAAFPELRGAHQIVVRSDPAQAPRVRAVLAGIDASPSRLHTSADGRTTVLTVPVLDRNDSPEAARSLTYLRKDLVPGLLNVVPGAEWAVSGDVARITDYPAHQRERLPLVLAALLAVTFLMTVAVFRSVVLGVLGVLLNLLSAAAALGTLLLLSPGPVGSRVPLFLLVVLFGLSMDYQFFVVSRIRAAARTGLPAPDAVRTGLTESAGVVTSAAVVMTTVFVSFIFVDLAELRQMGIVLAVGVLLDAFVVRVLILPTILRLLGERAWWPGRAVG
ncbi:MMPL family transporter [Actinoplanes couchii]|uniref:Membrane protein n=1 Tax=Actinoplanes couchii TaxID=403638 RepID=A0ABQ3XG49_9ACTN|nr:MMPL family transporter [Actinoplanes couchii]MDR6320926.1 RND superfamily putative drug exporter [Actinoplanes couchii]GID57438.1 membrane protein [Actinoplanes couchii]